MSIVSEILINILVNEIKIYQEASKAADNSYLNKARTLVGIPRNEELSEKKRSLGDQLIAELNTMNQGTDDGRNRHPAHPLSCNRRVNGSYVISMRI